MPRFNIDGKELLSLKLNRIPDVAVEYLSGDVADRIFDKLYADNPDYPKL